MRDAPQCNWRRWRVAPVEGPVTPPPAPRFARRTTTMMSPAADGIRHDLVARVRAEIAAGTYDTDERWRAAEDALLRRAFAVE